MEQAWYVRETLEYRKKRYMEHLSNDDLYRRAKDVIVNCIDINNEGKYAADTSDDFGQFFWVRFTHIVEEYRLRYGTPFRETFDKQNDGSLTIPKNFQLIEKVSTTLTTIQKSTEHQPLYKYGKQFYMANCLTAGQIRVSPASYYRNSSLNYAINDDELSFTTQNHPSNLKIEAFDKLGNFKGQVKPIENKMTFTLKTDYYLYSLSTRLSPRLFVDFENADSCLVIKDTTKFLKRLLEAFFKIKKGYFGTLGDAEYIDPIFSTYSEYDPFFCKHFRYAYQKEFRVCFIPFSDSEKLDPLQLTLGNLEECCDLIKINGIQKQT